MLNNQQQGTSPDLGVRIDVAKPLEVDYWSRALDIDEDALRRAVEAVGPYTASIERYVTGYPSPGLRQ